MVRVGLKGRSEMTFESPFELCDFSHLQMPPYRVTKSDKGLDCDRQWVRNAKCLSLSELRPSLFMPRVPVSWLFGLL